METPETKVKPKRRKSSDIKIPTNQEDLIREIIGYHREARFALKQQIRLERACESLIVFHVLKSDPNDKPALKKAYAQAKKVIKDALVDPSHPTHRVVITNANAVQPMIELRDDKEFAMTKLAETLPVWREWGKDIRGFGSFGLAQIVGECGDLTKYTTVSKLWKRLGLAVIDGKRQGAPGEGATSATWIAHGYNPARRSISWNIGQALFKAQSARVDEETGEVLSEAGHYRAIYDARKVYEFTRTNLLIVAHKRAMRYMEKIFLADLWSAWRQAETSMKPTTTLPDAEVCDGGDLFEREALNVCVTPVVPELEAA